MGLWGAIDGIDGPKDELICAAWRVLLANGEIINFGMEALRFFYDNRQLLIERGYQIPGLHRLYDRAPSEELKAFIVDEYERLVAEAISSPSEIGVVPNVWFEVPMVTRKGRG